MNLTAHPLSVAAELAWKGDLFGGANLAVRHRRTHRRPHWPSWSTRLGRSARELADELAASVCPVVPHDPPRA